jgi:ABC-type nickel/cobalt efflux system permease component RcnA
MRLRLLVAAVIAAALLVLPGAASAHPLGNFSINHLARVAVSADRVDVLYVLDEAEIPTFQQRGVSDAALLARKRAEVDKRLVVTVDGRRVALRPAGRAVLSHPPGQGGLKTTRVEIPLAADIRNPRDVRVADGTFPGRVGWKAIVVRPGRDTAVRSSVPASDPTDGLRRYPADLLKSPADVRSAQLTARPGAGTVQAPDGTSFAHAQDRRADRGLTKVFSDAAAGKGVLLLLLLTAFGWGAIHALSPGHGKAMVAAYLVGTRGTPRHAVALGGIVTLTHTIGVFALGGVTLALSAYILPEDLYPWLNLVSGLLVVGIGAAVLRSHLRRNRRRASHGQAHHHHHDHSHDHGQSHTHAHDHEHGHGHSHAHDHAHDPGHSHHHHHDHGHGHPDDHHHGHTHDHGHSHSHDHGAPRSGLRGRLRRVAVYVRGHSHDHDHDHGHSHLPNQPGWRGILAMGASAGLIPCPSALVVLLGAISQGQIALGMLLIVVFSLGLATTLSLLGLAVVLASRAVGRVRIPHRLVVALPAASAVVIVGVGCVLTARAIPLVG